MCYIYAHYSVIIRQLLIMRKQLNTFFFFLSAENMMRKIKSSRETTVPARVTMKVKLEQSICNRGVVRLLNANGGRKKKKNI